MAGARPDTWMPIYWGDYLRDTQHLKAAGHGAYLLLIASYWTRGGPLPDDDDELQTIARLDAKEWAKLKPKLARFFQVRDGVWRHGRIDAELETAQTRMLRAAKGGKAKAASGKPNGSFHHA